MCIYLGNDLNLTYKSQEHIFSATVGGILKLPNNYVSDQANSYFANLESTLVTQSVYGLGKMFYGPGDRGTNKPGRMPITILQTEKDEELGFCYKSKPIPIPQIKICENVEQISVIRDDLYHNDNDLSKLLNKLQTFNQDSKFILLDLEPQKFNFSFAYYNNTIYISTKNKNTIYECVKYLQKYALSKIDLSTKKEKDIKNAKVLINLKPEHKNATIFAKTAFNVLAYIKGSDYVENKLFDNFRDQIISKKEIEFWEVPKKMDITNFDKVGNEAHFCILQNYQNNFFAKVSFFNNFTLDFILSEKFDPYFNLPCVFICDWQNKKEYSLADKLYTEIFE